MEQSKWIQNRIPAGRSHTHFDYTRLLWTSIPGIHSLPYSEGVNRTIHASAGELPPHIGARTRHGKPKIKYSTSLGNRFLPPSIVESNVHTNTRRLPNSPSTKGMGTHAQGNVPICPNIFPAGCEPDLDKTSVGACSGANWPAQVERRPTPGQYIYNYQTPVRRSQALDRSNVQATKESTDPRCFETVPKRSFQPPQGCLVRSVPARSFFAGVQRA